MQQTLVGSFPVKCARAVYSQHGRTRAGGQILRVNGNSNRLPSRFSAPGVSIYRHATHLFRVREGTGLLESSCAASVK